MEFNPQKYFYFFLRECLILINNFPFIFYVLMMVSYYYNITIHFFYYRKQFRYIYNNKNLYYYMNKITWKIAIFYVKYPLRWYQYLYNFIAPSLMEEEKPRVFLIGAPKTGTTWPSKKRSPRDVLRHWRNTLRAAPGITYWPNTLPPPLILKINSCNACLTSS